MLPTQTIEKDLAELKIIQEMLITETNYNASLALLNAALAKDELVNNNTVLLKFQAIIPSLKIISDKLLANVNKGLHEEMGLEERFILKAERTQLMKAFFQAYQNYPRFFDEYTVENRINSVAFKALEAYISINTAKKFGLADLLSQPFQRGMRYEMLIKEALKYSDQLPDKNVLELKELLILISESIKTANSAMPVANTPVVKTPEPTPYRVGDYTRYYLFGSSNTASTNVAPVSPAKEEKQEGYRLGDITRSAISYWRTKPVEQTNIASGNVDNQPPSDLPPQLPPEFASNTDDIVSNNQPPTDLPDNFQQDPENPDNGSFTL